MSYTRPKQGGGGSPLPPERDRAAHSRALELAVGRALHETRQQLDSREPDIASGVPGFYLEFQVQADGANVFEKLGNRTKKIELVAVKPMPEQDGMVLATVFVPEKSTEYFLETVQKYRNESTNTKQSNK